MPDDRPRPRHACQRAELFHYRDRRGHEVDFVLEEDGIVRAVEVKSGRTVTGDQLRQLEYLASLVEEVGLEPESVLVYGGAERRRSRGVELVPWSEVSELGPRPA